MTGFRAPRCCIQGKGTGLHEDTGTLQPDWPTGHFTSPSCDQQSIAPLQETQTKPEGQIHFFPVLFDGRQVTPCMLCCGLPSRAHVESAETSC